MVDMIEAQTDFQANTSVFADAKTAYQSALTLGLVDGDPRHRRRCPRSPPRPGKVVALGAALAAGAVA